MRICGAKSVKCYRDAEVKLYGQDVIDGLRDADAKSFRQRCNCLDSCTKYMYDLEMDRTRPNWHEFLYSNNTSYNQSEDAIKY